MSRILTKDTGGYSRRPVACWRFSLTTKSFLKLRWMEIRNQTLWCRFSKATDLSFCLFINEHLNDFPTGNLEHGTVYAPSFVQDVIIVVLDSLYKVSQFFSRELTELKIVNVVNDVPFLNLPWKEHMSLDVFHHKDESIFRYINRCKIGIFFLSLLINVGIKYESRTKAFVSSKDIEKSSVKKLNAFMSKAAW